MRTVIAGSRFCEGEYKGVDGESMQHLEVGPIDRTVTIANAAFLSNGWKVASVSLYSLEMRPTSQPYTRDRNTNGEPITLFEKYAAIVVEKED